MLKSLKSQYESLHKNLPHLVIPSPVARAQVLQLKKSSNHRQTRSKLIKHLKRTPLKETHLIKSKSNKQAPRLWSKKKELTNHFQFRSPSFNFYLLYMPKRGSSRAMQRIKPPQSLALQAKRSQRQLTHTLCGRKSRET